MNHDPNSNSTDPNEETIKRPDAIETGMPATEDEGDDQDKDLETDAPDSEEEGV